MGGIDDTIRRSPMRWKTWDVAGQSAAASHPMRGETFPGSSRSKAPGGGGSGGAALPDGTANEMRVRADGETAFDRTPYRPPSSTATRESAITAAFAAE
jgi:hypothetical protein